MWRAKEGTGKGDWCGGKLLSEARRDSRLRASLRKGARDFDDAKGILCVLSSEGRMIPILKYFTTGETSIYTFPKLSKNGLEKERRKARYFGRNGAECHGTNPDSFVVL